MSQKPQRPKQTAIRLTETDWELIEAIKRDYNVTSTLAAIRLALRLAQLERFPVPQPMERK